MDKSTRNKLLAVVTFFIAILTLGGLGNAAVTVDRFYWVPFILDVPFFVAAFAALWRSAEKLEEKEGK